MDTDNAQHFNLNLSRLLTKFNSKIALTGKYLMLFKFNVYPQFAISRKLSNLLELSSWTLYLPVSSADYLCKQFRPRSETTKRRAWSGSKLLGILLIFLKDHFRKKQQQETNWFWKNISRRQNHDKLPRRQKESMNWNGRCYMYMHVSCLSLIFACFQYGTV